MAKTPVWKNRGLNRLCRLALGPMLMAAVGGAQALCLACTCAVTVTSVVFPSYNPLSSSPVDSVGNISLKFGGAAILNMRYTVALSRGSASSFLTRTLKSGANALTYNLFSSNALTTVWGDGQDGSAMWDSFVTIDLLGSSPTINLPVYARIHGGQSTAVPGNYSDTITVTVTYY